MDHWHAYTYTGPQRPKDAEARDPLSATPPLTIAAWANKPRGMLAATFGDPADALAWLAEQLARTPPLPGALPAATVLGYARERLTRHPGDQITRYYTASQYVVRDLIHCTGGPGCPGAPPAG